MASPENQHCASCIGTLSFPGADDRSLQKKTVAGQKPPHAATRRRVWEVSIQTRCRGGRSASACTRRRRHRGLHSRRTRPGSAGPCGRRRCSAPATAVARTTGRGRSSPARELRSAALRTTHRPAASSTQTLPTPGRHCSAVSDGRHTGHQSLRLRHDSTFARLPATNWQFRHMSESHTVVGRSLSPVSRRGTHCRNVYTTLLTVLLFLAVFLKHVSSWSTVRAEWSSIPESNKDWLQMCSNMIINFNYTIISN